MKKILLKILAKLYPQGLKYKKSAKTIVWSPFRKRGSVFTILFLFLFLPLSYAQQADTVKLAWDANTESDLAGYKLYIGTASGTYDSNIDVTNVTEYTIPNLTVGTTYFFVGTAYDTSGNESGYSNEVSYLVVDTVSPSNMINLRVIIITN